MKGNGGYTRLLDVHQTIARDAQPRIEIAAYGTITASGGLVVDHFAHEFETGSYGFLLRDTLPDPMAITTPTAVGDHGTHTHNVVRPAELIPFLLVPGCRVQVLWNFARTRPFVVGIVEG